MARHELTIPINKSSNNNAEIYLGPGDYYYPPYTSTKLYLSHMESYGPTYHVNNIGLGWDDSVIPKNKIIVNTKIFLYALRSYSGNFIYRKVQFNEGNTLPRANPSDGFLTSKFTIGWNELVFNGSIGNSLVIENTQIQNRASGFTWGEFYSHRNSTNKPYVVVTYDDLPPDKPSSLYPSNITLNPRTEIRFSWLHNSNEELQQKGFVLEYSINGGSAWATVSEITPNQYYDMDANTLPESGTVLWRAKTIDGNDEVSEFTTASFKLGTPPQKAPTTIKPIGEYLDSTKPIVFGWNFEGGSPGETQSKFDLEYSINNGNTWTDISEITSNENCELPENTFNITGNVLWRVRTYNNYDEVSPWSENRNFYVISSPPIPQITNVNNNARPTIEWTSQGQHIYELEILQGDKVIYGSGSIPSTSDRSSKIPVYLEDGNYKARLRVVNEYSLYSPWAEKSFIISTLKPNKPIMDIYNGEHMVTIKTSNTSLKTYIYRDNEYIGDVINNNFIDYTGENNKHYKYFIRTIDENDNFNDSDIKLASCKFAGNTLALVENPQDFIKLRVGLNNNPKKSNQFGVGASIQNYDGRKYSVVEFSEFNNMSKTLIFYVETKCDVDRLIEMIDKREIFLYRNRDGSNVYGAILGIDYDEEETFYGYEIGFTITKTDYKGVAYD